MNPYWKAILLVLVAGVSQAAEIPAASPVGVRVEAYASYTDNLFQNANRRSDWITSARIDLDYTPLPNLGFYYTGDTRIFTEYDDLFNHIHLLGMSYMWKAREDRLLYTGLVSSTRRNRSAYQYRNYVQGGEYVASKLYLQPELLLRLGYQLRLREYDYMPNFSFAEQVAYAQLSRFLPTQTTILGSARIGLKTFTHSMSPASVDLNLQPRAGGKENLAQFMLRFKVAQSLAAGIGLQVEYQHRLNLMGRNRYVDRDYNPDEKLFDDHYSHEGSAWRSTLKYVRKENLRISVTGRSAREQYDGQPAMDLDGMPMEAMREDRRSSVFIEEARTFPVSGSWMHDVQLNLGWHYADIDSNDPYYHTEGTTYSVGMKFGL